MAGDTARARSTLLTADLALAVVSTEHTWTARRQQEGNKRGGEEEEGAECHVCV
jgi:hypothetical protein